MECCILELQVMLHASRFTIRDLQTAIAQESAQLFAIHNWVEQWTTVAWIRARIINSVF